MFAGRRLVLLFGAVEKRIFRIICDMLRRSGVASSTEIGITDVRIFGKAQCVFSCLDQDRDHICADFGSAGLSFSRKLSYFLLSQTSRRLRCGVSGPLRYRFVKVSLSRVRERREFWWSRARTRGCARVERAKIRKSLIRRWVCPAQWAPNRARNAVLISRKPRKTLPISSSSRAPARSTKINHR